MVARKKKPRTRRRKTAINLLNAAESIVQGSILTRWAFGTSLAPFLFEGWLMPVTPGRADFSSQSFGGSGSSWNLSLAEIVQSAVPGGELGMSEAYAAEGGVFPIVMRNLRTNAPQFLVATIGARIGFKVLRKATTKQRSQINRNILKPLGLEKEVKV